LPTSKPFDATSGVWPGSFEAGARWPFATRPPSRSPEAIANAIGDLAPHKVTTKTLSGRVSRRPDPSTRFVNTTYVKGSGAVGREGMDSTENKKTKQSKGSSGFAYGDEEDFDNEAYDDEFLGPVKALNSRYWHKGLTKTVKNSPWA